MAKAQKTESTSDLLKKIKKHKGKHITFGEMMEIFREVGFSILLIIFAFPMALPLPALGVATILALPLLFLSIQLILGFRSPWVPEWLAKKKIKMSFMNKAIDKVLPSFIKLETFLKPRIAFLSTKFGEKLIGVVCLICSISVALPFPFTNTLPSMAIVIMSIGLFERDGIVSFIGMAFGIAGVSLIGAVYYFGIETVKSFFV